MMAGWTLRRTTFGGTVDLGWLEGIACAMPYALDPSWVGRSG